MAILLFSAGVFLFVKEANATLLAPIVNEVLPYPASGPEWVELYNPNDVEIDIGGWKLNKANSLFGSLYTFPAGTKIAPLSYFVIDKGTGPTKYSFELLHYTTDVTLFYSDNSVASQLHFPEYSITYNSWGWYPNADTSGSVISIASPTKGFSNGGEDTTPPIILGNPGWGKSIPLSGYAGDGASIEGYISCGGYIKNDGDYRGLWGEALDDSGIDMYQRQVVKDGFLIYSGNESTNYTGTFVPGVSGGASEGNYYVRVRATDTYGNSSINDINWADTSSYLSWCKMVIDVSLPSTTDSLSDSDWHNEDVLVNLTCSDNFLCANTYYTLDGAEPTSLSSSGTSFSITTTGIYTLEYFSVDNAGNSEIVKTAMNLIKVDKTKPNNVQTTDSGEWTDNPKLTFSWPESLDGAGSGISYYQFWLSTAGNETNALDLDVFSSNKWKNAGNVLTYTLTDEEASLLTSGDTYYAKVKAVDNVGNIANTFASSWSDGVTLDTQFPQSVLVSPISDFYNATNWNGTINGTASDNVSGLLKVEVKIKVLTPLGTVKYWDGTDFGLAESWITASGTDTWSYSFTPIEGVYTFYYKASDNAGNVEVVNEFTDVVFDDTVPQVSYSLNPANPDGENNWYKTVPTITLSVTDTNLDKIEYQYDSETGIWFTYSSPLTPEEGEHTLYYRALDKAENISATKSFSIKVSLADTESPKPVDNLRAVASDSLVVLEWDKSPSTDVDYYRIYKSEDKKFIPNPETRLAEVSSSERSYDDEDVDNDTTYYYYVIAFDMAGNNSSAEGISAKPSGEEEETVVEEIPNLEIPQGAVLGVEEKVKEVEVPTLKETKTENIVPKESGDLKGSVLALENTVDKEVKPSKSVWDFWWVALILFGMGGLGFYFYRER